MVVHGIGDWSRVFLVVEWESHSQIYQEGGFFSLAKNSTNREKRKRKMDVLPHKIFSKELAVAVKNSKVVIDSCWIQLEPPHLIG